MWTLTALFCSVADPTICQPSGPTTLFPTEEACVAFVTENIPSIDFDKVTLQYRCINWGEPV